MTDFPTTETTPAQPQLLSRRACESCHKKKTRCDRKLPICSLCDRTATPCLFPSKRKKPAQSLGPRKKTSIEAFDNDAEWLFPLSEKDLLTAPSTNQRMPNCSNLNFLDSNVDYAILGQSQSNNVLSQHQEPSAAYLEDFTSSKLFFEDLLPQPPSTYSGSLDDDSRKTETPENHYLCASLSTHLMELFFDHVQPWLPILHKTKFLRRYGDRLINEDPLKDLASDEAFLLCTAFSLAARYSSHELLASVPAVDRGHKFFESASDYLSKCRAFTSPTLAYLQGSIMYSFYSYNRGVYLQGWIHTGVCVQLAYELGLADMDDDDSNTFENMTWSEKEEMRRAWWLVWELDTFGSIVSLRPLMIDHTRTSVFLPVSDEQWFSDVPLTSARLISDPGSCWKSLQNAENQSARAWFLVVNYLMSLVQTSRHRKDGISSDMQIRLENDISCMKLALPPSMLLDADRTDSNPIFKHDWNWIIGTHLMLISASWYIQGIGAKASGQSLIPKQLAFEKARILSRWRQDDVATAHPFFTFLLVNPFSDHNDGQRSESASLSSCRDLSRLLLRQFSFKWTIGLIASRVDEICERRDSSATADKELVKRYLTCFETSALGLSPKSSGFTGPV